MNDRQDKISKQWAINAAIEFHRSFGFGEIKNFELPDRNYDLKKVLPQVVKTAEFLYGKVQEEW